jgi:hypothetical protein
MGWIQLNLRVKEETKEALRKLCDEQGISFAQALQSYVEASDRAGYLLASFSNSIDSNASKDSILDTSNILERLERLEKSDRIETLESSVKQSLVDLKERLSKIEKNSTLSQDDRLNALEQKLETVISDPQYVTQLELRLQALERRLHPLPSNNKSESIDGLSNCQLADILNTHNSTISRWKAKGDPRLDDWELIRGKWYRKSNC